MTPDRLYVDAVKDGPPSRAPKEQSLLEKIVITPFVFVVSLPVLTYLGGTEIYNEIKNFYHKKVKRIGVSYVMKKIEGK